MGMRWMEATSRGLKVSSRSAPAQTTTGVITKPERVRKSSSVPSTSAGGSSRSTSSCSSRKAVVSTSSPSSRTPPGSAHWPGWFLRAGDRRVRIRAASWRQASCCGSPGTPGPKELSTTVMATAAPRALPPEDAEPGVGAHGLEAAEVRLDAAPQDLIATHRIRVPGG